MIIWGTRGVTSSAEMGSFHCPQCEARRTYDRKRVRRFFTLYFIPLIPLDNLGEYIECRTCKGTFKDAVLRYDPEAQQKALQVAFTHALRRSMVLMMLADGEATTAELEAIARVYKATTGRELSQAELSAEVDKATTDPRPLAQHLRQVAPQLTAAGKEMLLRGALAVAVADGKVEEKEAKLLESMALALELSSAHLRGILTEATTVHH